MVHRIVDRVEHLIRPGSIVLSHDLGKPHVIVAYTRALPQLKSRYHLISLPTTPTKVGTTNSR